MKLNLALPVCAGLLLAAGAANAQNSSMTLGSTDREFLSEAAESNLAEIQAAELALERSSDVNVRRLAHMVIDHHKMAQEQLQAWGTAMNITLPTSPSTESSDDYSNLERLSGSVFDHAYIKSQVKAHKKAVWRFQRTLQETEDPQTKTFAWGTLPTLNRHLDEFKYLKSKCSNYQIW